MTTNNEPTARPAPCDPDCPGFAIFNEDEQPEIQRCMDCNRFATDLDAMKYMVAMACAAEKSRLRPSAFYHDRTIDPHGGPWLPVDPIGRPLPEQDRDPVVCSGCGAEGITTCIRVDLTTGQVDTEDTGAFPYCPRCKADEDIGPIAKSAWVDPGPGDAVDALIRSAVRYVEGAWDIREISDYWSEYGPGLVRGHNKLRVLALAVNHANQNPPQGMLSSQLVDALGGTVGATFLSTVYECF